MIPAELVNLALKIGSKGYGLGKQTYGLIKNLGKFSKKQEKQKKSDVLEQEKAQKLELAKKKNINKKIAQNVRDKQLKENKAKKLMGEKLKEGNQNAARNIAKQLGLSEKDTSSFINDYMDSQSNLTKKKNLNKEFKSAVKTGNIVNSVNQSSPLSSIKDRINKTNQPKNVSVSSMPLYKKTSPIKGTNVQGPVNLNQKISEMQIPNEFKPKTSTVFKKSKPVSIKKVKNNVYKQPNLSRTTHIPKGGL